MIPVCEPSLIGNEKKYVMDCLDTNWISSMGEYIPKFEERFSSWCSTKHGVANSNGTTALHLALVALKIGKGDEVIVPTFTMIASCNAVIYSGATPVLVDSEMDTWNMDISKVEAKITKRTKAIMVVHTYGHPVDMDPLKDLAEKYGLYIIEDAAEAHGAEYKGKRCGSLGDIACFSFYSNKIITTGEGGMIVTDDEDLAERARLLRNHAFTPNRFTHEDLGYNYRMTNVQAAIGLAQMENADKLVQARIDNAARYNHLLKDVDGIIFPPKKAWARNVYWMYGILLDGFGMTKEKLMDELYRNGVQTRSFFIPMHKQPVYAQGGPDNYPDVSADLPVSEKLGETGLYLPSSSTLSKEDLVRVVEAIKKIKDTITLSS